MLRELRKTKMAISAKTATSKINNQHSAIVNRECFNPTSGFSPTLNASKHPLHRRFAQFETVAGHHVEGGEAVAERVSGLPDLSENPCDQLRREGKRIRFLKRL